MEPPSIDDEPTNVLEPAGEDIQFTATVTGEETTLEWRRDGLTIPLSDLRISGIDTAILSIMNIAAGDEGSYRLTVSNNAATIMSVTVTLTIRKSYL